VQVDDDRVSLDQERFGLAAPLGPRAAPAPHLVLHFRDAAIGAAGWKPVELDAHDLWIEVPGDGLHVVTVDRTEELPQRVDFGVHALALR
jgi:hypothetical protein